MVYVSGIKTELTNTYQYAPKTPLSGKADLVLDDTASTMPPLDCVVLAAAVMVRDRLCPLLLTSHLVPLVLSPIKTVPGDDLDIVALVAL